MVLLKFSVFVRRSIESEVFQFSLIQSPTKCYKTGSFMEYHSISHSSIEKLMPLCSIDSDDLEKQDLVRHHHYIACKDYDRTIMNKLNSVRNVDLLMASIKKDQSEQVNNSALKNKRIMLVEDEDDLVVLFKMILESDAGLKVDSYTDPFCCAQ